VLESNCKAGQVAVAHAVDAVSRCKPDDRATLLNKGPRECLGRFSLFPRFQIEFGGAHAEPEFQNREFLPGNDSVPV